MVSYYRAFAPKSEAVNYMDYRATLREEFEIHKFRLVESFNSEVFFKGDFTVNF